MSLKDLSKLFEEATNTKLKIIWGAREYREREVMTPYENGEMSRMEIKIYIKRSNKKNNWRK